MTSKSSKLLMILNLLGTFLIFNITNLKSEASEQNGSGSFEMAGPSTTPPRERKCPDGTEPILPPEGDFPFAVPPLCWGESPDNEDPNKRKICALTDIGWLCMAIIKICKDGTTNCQYLFTIGVLLNVKCEIEPREMRPGVFSPNSWEIKCEGLPDWLKFLDFWINDKGVLCISFEYGPEFVNMCYDLNHIPNGDGPGFIDPRS